ncbi:MAG: OmpA family protein [Flavobacteriales bacterium]
MKQWSLTFLCVFLLTLSSFGQGSGPVFLTPTEEQTQRITSLITASLSLYVDDHLVVVNDVLAFTVKTSKVIRDLNGIVKNGSTFYEYHELSDFKGFSNTVEARISELNELRFSPPQDWERLSENQRKQARYFFFQKAINDFKLLLQLEVGDFSNQNLMIDEDRGVNAELDSLLKSVDYSPEVFLTPIEINLDPDSLGMTQLRDESQLPNDALPADLSAFEQSLLEMLKINTDQLARLELQMRELQSTQIAMMEQRQNERNQELQMQIDDLRAMVLKLSQTGVDTEIVSTEHVSVSPSENELDIELPESISLYFDRGQSSLNITHQLMLAEVIDIMVRYPQLDLFITGMADRVGDEKTNLQLSRDRASAVKSFILRSGLSEDRFVINFVGDSKSENESTSDRKVVLEFVR